MEKQIGDLILNGNTLSDVYITVTPQPAKKLISETFRKIDNSILANHGWNCLRIKIEKALFSLHRQHHYSRNVNVGADLFFDYLIYENGVLKFAIVILGQEFLLCDGDPVFDAREYENSVDLLKKKSDYCSLKKLPLLQMPILELIDWPFLADEFRNTLEEIDYVKKHNQWAKNKYLDISNLWMCTYENYYMVRASKKVGCYSCGSLVDPKEAILSGQDDSMACPICSETTLISDFQGFKISQETIAILKEKYKDSED